MQFSLGIVTLNLCRKRHSMKIQIPSEITAISQIQALATAGFDNWQEFGNVNVTVRGDLLLFDYNTAAHISNTWPYFERVCRGLILNKRTGEIVARPFDKFFYFFANGRKVSGHIVSITEKLDGSLGILYRHKGETLISTKGSFFSPQARWASKFLKENFDLSDLGEEWTLLFEIIYPDNRVVVNYGSREDLVLLAARNRFTGDFMPFFPNMYELAQHYGFSLPQVYTYNNITDLIINTGKDIENFEGWVVEFSDGQRVKFKTDRYVEIHRYIRQIDFPNILKAVQSGDIDYITRMIPADMLTEVYRWIEEIQEKVEHINAKTVMAFTQAPRGNRQVYKTWVDANHPDLAPYLMQLYEGKAIEPLIYELAFQEKQLRNE
jgi:RNA ligase